jgi:Arc/MetJ family transcription regulator
MARRNRWRLRRALLRKRGQAHLFLPVSQQSGCPAQLSSPNIAGRRLTNKPLALHTVLCDNPHMATNLALDDNLIEEARRAGRHKTKKDAVTAALAEYVQRRKQLRILKAFGSVDFDPKYDYKAERRRKRS